MAIDETRTLIAAGLAELTRQATTPPEPWLYGRDLVCINDLTDTLQETDPNTTQSLAQDLFHRVTTERGTLVDDPDYGDDISGHLSSATTPREIASIESRQELEILKDDRVAEVSVTVAVRHGTSTQLDVTYHVTPRDPRLQPFEMILAVTSAETILREIT